MKNRKEPFDIIGIGIGPFNLGLAALCYTIPELSCLFIDQNETFNWHPGMMIPWSRLQVPFYADLVTVADPCNPFSFMAFLKAKKRMFRFAISENYFIKRTEYNEYCRWVVNHLPSLQFNTACIEIKKENDLYHITTNKGSYSAKNIILGVGAIPYIPEAAHINDENVFHSSKYLYHKENILDLDSITIIGSGQSAAEIFFDLLQCYTGELSWFTRSKRFFPMDYSKLTLEMSTPDYIDHFHTMPEKRRHKTLSEQDSLYKGINHSLISDIYDMLVEKNSDKIRLHTNCELKNLSDDLSLSFLHLELQREFIHKTDAVILSTGYHSYIPDFTKQIHHLLHTDKDRYTANYNYSIDEDNSVFVQNAEQPTHGFNAADLGLGPYRNSVILNSILGREHFSLEKNITFQTFGLPANCQ